MTQDQDKPNLFDDNPGNFLDSLDIYLPLFDLNPEDISILDELMPLYDNLMGLALRQNKSDVVEIVKHILLILESIKEEVFIPNDSTSSLIIKSTDSIKNIFLKGKPFKDQEYIIAALKEIVNNNGIDYDSINKFLSEDEKILKNVDEEAFDINGVSKKDLEFFYNPGRQHRDTIEECIKALNNGYSQDCIDTLIRTFQGLGGALNFIKYDDMALMAGNIEDGLMELSSEEPDAHSLMFIMDQINEFLNDLVAFLKKIEENINIKEGQIFPEAQSSVGSKTNLEVVSKGIKQQDASASHIQNMKSSKTMRISISKINELMNSVEELLITNSSLLKIQEEMIGEDFNSVKLKSLSSIYTIFEKITEVMHNEMLAMLMSPVRSLFNKFKHVIEDLSIQQKKDISVTISGEGTQVDRLVLETLKDPLIHLIRNAVDHGIEGPEEREKAGKSRTGHVALRAFNDINSVVIEIEDDGKGIDYNKIREKAIEKGLSTIEEIKGKTSQEILDFIFQPGFSMAKEITNISGRGVGMDVVKTSLNSMGGTIDIDTHVGEGTCFIIRLPLAMTMADALIVQVGNEKYSIPSDAVEKIMKIPLNGFCSIYDKKVVSLPERTLPYRYLLEILNSDFKEEWDGFSVDTDTALNNKNKKEHLILVLSNEGSGVALGVDKIIGKQKVVIKSLDGLLSSLSGISGASIQGDGSVILVLDGQALCEKIKKF